MRFLTTANLLVLQVQFIGLLANLDIDWPESWRDFLSFMQIFNFDPQDLIGQREIPLIDFRVLFILIAVLLPIFINICVLLLARNFTTVIWYGVLCGGVVLLLVGLLGKYLPGVTAESGALGTGENEEEARKAADFYIIIGAVMVGVTLLMALAYWIGQKCKPHQEEATVADVRQYKKDHEYYAKFHRVRTFWQLIISSLLIVGSLILLGVIEIVILDKPSQSGGVTGGILVVASIFFLVGGVLLMIYMVMHLCQWGRNLMSKFRDFMKGNLLMLLLLLITSSYVPIMQYCISMFMCTTFSCPAGTVFNPRAERPTGSYDKSAARYCDPCNFLNTGCASWNVTALCPATDLKRNWLSPDTTCDDEASSYFYVASILVLLMYMFCIPFLFKRVIDRLVWRIHQDSVVPGGDSIDDKELWKRQVNLVSPAASSLYESFEIQHRYTMLIYLAQRLLVVIILVIVAPFSNTAVALVLFVHAVATVLLVWLRPYLHTFEQILATSLAACNVLNGLYALWVWQKGSGVPSYTTGIFIFFNVVIPAVASLVMIIMRSKSRKESEEEFRHAVADSVNQPSSGSTEPYAVNVGKEQKRQKLARKKLIKRVLKAMKDEVDKSTLKPEERAMWETLDLLNAKNHDLCEGLNTRTLKSISVFFMVMGIVFIVALGACVLGTLRQEDTRFIMGTSSYSQHYKYSLGGNYGWENFTSHCCCIESTHPSPRYTRMERWLCDNGNIVDRGRVTKDGDDGLPIRAMCGIFHEPLSCSIWMKGNRPVLSCPSNVEEQVLKVVTKRAFDYYW